MKLERIPITELRRKSKDLFEYIKDKRKPIYLTTCQVDTLLLVPMSLAEKFEEFLKSSGSF